MSKNFSHERLDVYRLYLDTASLCEAIVSSTTEEPIVVFDHLDRAMESIGVNLIRANMQIPGAPLRSSYFDVSIASTHECAASLDVCAAKNVIEADMYSVALVNLWRIRGMLLGLKRASANRVREGHVSYGTPGFPYSGLDMYQVSLESVRWMHDLLVELKLRTRTKRKLDISTTGTVLNIAEGYGRATTADQNRFMKTAQEHAFQTVLENGLTITGTITYNDGNLPDRNPILIRHYVNCERKAQR